MQLEAKLLIPERNKADDWNRAKIDAIAAVCFIAATVLTDDEVIK